MKQYGILIISVVCGIAAMLLAKVYIKNQEDKLRSRFEMAQVVVAKQDIPLGTPLTREMLGVLSIPKKAATNRNVTPEQAEQLYGRKVIASLQRNSFVLWSDITVDEQRGGSLAGMVNPNERAISIPVDITSSVTGLVEPSDHVDILGTFTFPSTKGDPQLDTVTLTILQNVTVLATGRDTTRSLMDAGGARRSGSYSQVTLLVTPQEAEMLVFAMQKGRLSLSLRNPSDVSSTRDLSNINFNYLEKKVSTFNEDRQQRLNGTTRSR